MRKRSGGRRKGVPISARAVFDGTPPLLSFSMIRHEINNNLNRILRETEEESSEESKRSRGKRKMEKGSRYFEDFSETRTWRKSFFCSL